MIMKLPRCLLLLSCFLVTIISGESSSDLLKSMTLIEIPVKTVTIHAQKVFRFAFNPNLFEWKNGNYGGVSRYAYSYRPSLHNLPEMPRWMKYKYSDRHSAGEIHICLHCKHCMLSKIILQDLFMVYRLEQRKSMIWM